MHKLFCTGKPVGTLTDFVSVSRNCFIRKFSLTENISLRLGLHPQAQVLSAHKYRIPSGALVFNDYPCPFDVFLRVSGENYGLSETELTLKAGEGFIAFEIEDSAAKMGEISADWAGNAYAETADFWRARSKEMLNCIHKTTENNSEKYEGLLEGLYFTVISQSSFDGGGMAGHQYPLSYVRDMFGVSKCYQRLGLKVKAKSLLEYYHKIFRQCGKICNAQPMGYINGVFHIHENDEAEITGYLILQAVEYVEQNGDFAFLAEIKDMLLWALKQQIKALHNNMLPFNGDETYIAGGILPRTAIDDGSFESTMLFISSAEKLIKLLKADGFTEKQINAYEYTVAAVKNAFRSNFLPEGKIVINNPSRRDGLPRKKERNGVCLSCKRFGALKNIGEGLFVCPACEDKAAPVPDAQIYELPLLMLMPAFVAPNLFTKDELKNFASELMSAYYEIGTISLKKECVVGYEYGLLLNLLTVTHDERADVIFDKLLTWVDDVGSFAEYYNNDIPFNTRYRPWESAVNLYAVIGYLRKR